MINPFQTFLDIFGLQIADLSEGDLYCTGVSLAKGKGTVSGWSVCPFKDFIVPSGKSYPGVSLATWDKNIRMYVVIENGTKYEFCFFR